MQKFYFILSIIVSVAFFCQLLTFLYKIIRGNESGTRISWLINIIKNISWLGIFSFLLYISYRMYENIDEYLHPTSGFLPMPKYIIIQEGLKFFVLIVFLIAISIIHWKWNRFVSGKKEINKKRLRSLFYIFAFCILSGFGFLSYMFHQFDKNYHCESYYSGCRPSVCSSDGICTGDCGGGWYSTRCYTHL